MNKLHLSLSLLLFLWGSASYAQDDFLLELYGGDSAIGVASEQPKVFVKAVLAPANSSTDAWLVLDVSIPKDWHLYSLTQKKGATMPAKITLNENENFKQLSPFYADRKPIINNVEYFSVPLEEHDKQVIWLTKIRFADESRVVLGTLSGQICQSGEGGSCIPIDVEFEANWNADFDVTPILEASKNVPAEFAGFQEGTVNRVHGSMLQFENIQTEELVSVSNIGVALLYAFLGGLILNIMPCVLPIIGLKILSFFEQAGKSRARAFFLNVCYSFGILSVFFVLAFLSVGLNTMFSYNLFNILMAVVVFTLALSMMDVWELSTPSFLGGQKSVELMQKEGGVGAFFKGIITTLLAIPCSAPMLGPALVWADAQIRNGDTAYVFMAYSMIGIGMASPYLILGAFPELLRFLPKPGEWMSTFKHVMGYFLLLAVVWILFFVPFDVVVPTIALLFGFWFVCWLIGRIPYGTPFSKQMPSYGISFFVIGVIVLFSFQIPKVPNPYNIQAAMQRRLEDLKASAGQTVDRIDQKHWKPYSRSELEAGLSAGRIVVIDFTADWCLTCKAFEATVLHSQAVLDTLDALNAVSMQGDVTTGAGEAAELLKKLGGGNAVPIVAIFDPKNPNQPKLIRGGSTAKTLINAMNKIGD